MKNLNIYTYPNLPINKQGIVSKDGSFISFYPIDKNTFSQNSIKSFMEEFYNIDISSIDLYQFRQGIYNYKDILVNYLGYCLYESYTTSSLAVIKVPNNITEEQKNTLVKLVTINNNDKDSLLPLKRKIKIKK